jgi:tetratricopeptide (TPR) repeat protein
MPETPEQSGRIMKRMSVKSRRVIAVIAVLFLLVAGGLAALYLTNRREVTTSSAAAYEAYREGIENQRRFYRKEAQVAFARALALDPNFVMAMLRLASLSNNDQAVSLVERARRLRGRLTDRERLFVDMAYADREGKIEERNKLARTIFDKYPDDVDAALILCSIEMSQGHAERALEIYGNLLARDPNNAAVYNLIGYYYAWRGDYDRAMENLKKYQFMAPDQANPYDSMGEIQAYSGHYDEAITNLNRALALKPDFFESTYHLGVVYEGKGDYAKAISYYETATREALTDGRRTDLLVSALRAALFAGDRDRTREVARRIADLPKGKNSEILQGLTEVALDLVEGRNPEAERRLAELKPKLLAAHEKEAKGSDRKPQFSGWNALMALAKARQGKTDEAIALYETNANPPNPWGDFEGRRWVFEARAHLAELLARKGDLDRAEKLLAENKKWNPSWAPTRPSELVVEQMRREKVLAASVGAANDKAPR